MSTRFTGFSSVPHFIRSHIFTSSLFYCVPSLYRYVSIASHIQRMDPQVHCYETCIKLKRKSFVKLIFKVYGNSSGFEGGSQICLLPDLSGLPVRRRPVRCKAYKWAFRRRRPKKDTELFSSPVSYLRVFIVLKRQEGRRRRRRVSIWWPNAAAAAAAADRTQTFY